MAGTEQLFRLTFQTTANTGGLTALTQATNQQTAATRQLTAAEVNRLNLPTPDAVIAQGRRNAAAATKAAAEEERQAMLKMGQAWEAARKKKAGPSMGQGGGDDGGMGGARGQGLLQAAYFADDLQYGLRGVMNNVPQMLLALGPRLAALAGPIGLAIGGAALSKSIYDAVVSGVDEAAKASEAKLAQTVERARAMVDASLTRTMEDAGKKLEAELQAMRDKTDAELGRAQANAESIDKFHAKDQASKAEKANAGAGAMEMEAGQANTQTDNADIKKLATDYAKQRADEIKDAALRQAQDDEVKTAADKRRNLERGLEDARKVASTAEEEFGTFGINSRDARRKIADDMRRVGIQSDEEKFLDEYNAAKDGAADAAKSAQKFETERDSLDLGSVPWMAANKQAQHFRGKATEFEAKEATLRPQFEENQRRYITGNLNYDTVDPKTLTSAQDVAFKQGQADLQAQKAKEDAAREALKQQKDKHGAAFDSLEEAKRAEQQAIAKRDDFYLGRHQERVKNQQVPELDPQQFGAMMQRQRARGGVNDGTPVEGFLPDLPAGAPMGPMPDNGPPPLTEEGKRAEAGLLPTSTMPDLSSTNQAINAAMEQATASVMEAMNRIVASSEQMALKMQNGMAALGSRVDTLAANIQTVSTMPT